MNGTETTLFMIRHGRLVNSHEDVFTGQRDVPLSEEGKKETLFFLDRLSRESISLVISSDLSRTLTPAKIYSERFNCPLVVLKELREIDAGRWENKSYRDVAEAEAEYLEKRYKDPVNIPFPEGESLSDLKKRVVYSFDPLIEENRGKRLLLVGHAGVIRVLVLHYLKIPLSQFFSFEIDYSSLSVLRFFSDGNVTLKLLNAGQNRC